MKNAKYYEFKDKNRESFRPFAPAILEEDVSDQFDIEIKTHIWFVASIKKVQEKVNAEEKNLFGIEKLKISKSNLPAIIN